MSGTDFARGRVARSWLDLAQDDLRAAQYCVEGTPPALGPAAYHCQQSVEKSLKAALVLAAERVGKTHDLHALVEAVVGALPMLTTAATACRDISPWGVAFRYPVSPALRADLPTSEEIRTAIELSARLLKEISVLVEAT